MKPRLYLETTITSYLTAWPSRDVVILGHQETTREWWATCRGRFELFVSALVVNEAAQGDAEAARLRLQALRDIPELAASPSAEALAAALLREGAVPAVARIDRRTSPLPQCMGWISLSHGIAAISPMPKWSRASARFAPATAGLAR